MEFCIEYNGREIELTLEFDGDVRIAIDGVWTGAGQWDDGRIVNCSAWLDRDAGVSNRIYAELESDDHTEHAQIDFSSLPTFGGATPNDTSEIISWDETHLLFGDLTVMSREGWSILNGGM